MVDPKVETVQQIYAAFGRGDIAAILDQLADDVELVAEPKEPFAPWHGRRTKAEAPACFRALSDTFAVTAFSVLRMASGDTDVLAIIRCAVTAKRTGKQGVLDLQHWWRFRDGKVALFVGAENTAVTAELLRPAEPPPPFPGDRASAQEP